MPVRSLNSSVFRWPDEKAVEDAAIWLALVGYGEEVSLGWFEEKTLLVRSSINRAKRERISLPRRDGIGRRLPGIGSRIVRVRDVDKESIFNTAAMVLVAA